MFKGEYSRYFWYGVLVPVGISALVFCLGVFIAVNQEATNTLPEIIKYGIDFIKFGYVFSLLGGGASITAGMMYWLEAEDKEKGGLFFLGNLIMFLLIGIWAVN